MSDNLEENHLIHKYSKKEILQELERILSSDPFSRSAVLSNFLKFIVEETLEGHTKELKEYTIAVYGLGKATNFNPQSNAIVRINAGRLRRLLKAYYNGPGKTNTLKIEVIKGSYVPVFRTQEITSKKSVLKEESTPAAHSFSRSKLTLAILPFRNLCADDDYQFFVDGFGEELTRIFSTSEEISVVAHYSTLRYESHNVDVRSIGADLGVHYIIIGSVKRSTKKIKINIGLVETLNGMQIWSKTYTHDLDKNETIDIQDQINEDVFSILSGHYGFIFKDTLHCLVDDDMNQDLQAFDAILWYNYAQISHYEENCIKCRKAIEKVLHNDPNHIMCLLTLGDLYLFCYSLGYKTIDNPINEAYKLIQKALLISPFSQFGNLLLGWVNVYLGKKKEAIQAFNYSMQLAPPSLTFKGTLGFGLSCSGEYKQGYLLIKEALDFNPYCPWWYYMGLYFVYYKSKKYEEALECAQKMYASDNVYLIPLLNAAAKGQLGAIDDAQSEVHLLNEKFSDILSQLKTYLSTFILDESLIDEIINGAKKSGLLIP
ncbi:hypothetical protein [Formosa sp. PL04]|uniref:tetratricopeptide repeat protein n=1 Tax=Formosa sp. PL04 TaxID=3081755 RepID=UPI002981A206|nr:hypothetical protein [Formosa sp. PL04]MDW5290595.1 hypothetical protein [Formosa sp. PL04]